MINIETKEDVWPICPHCKQELTKIWTRPMKGDLMGSRRHVYFCPHCRACLGVSHRKGFFLGL